MSAAALPLMMIASSAISTMGQVQQANAAARASEYNARVTEMEAKAEEARVRRESAKRMGAIRTGIAKSGVTTQGTPLLVLAESAELAELDALNVRWSGETGANLDRMRARSARASIPYTVGAGLLAGATQYNQTKGF